MADPTWTSVAVVGGLIAATVGLFLASIRTAAANRAALTQVEIAAQRQITEAFTQAINQLGSSNDLEVRLGAIYALERIAYDSERYHWPVMETLAAYVRIHAPVPRSPETDEIELLLTQSEQTDIHACIAVLRRRNSDLEIPGQNIDLGGADLSDANLTGADLAGADLSAAGLTGANLHDADLTGANLAGANLTGADLSGANLTGAVISEEQLDASRRGVNTDARS
jgi:hypothetical protein